MFECFPCGGHSNDAGCVEKITVIDEGQRIDGKGKREGIGNTIPSLRNEILTDDLRKEGLHL
jgi:hypothetical protein